MNRLIKWLQSRQYRKLKQLEYAVVGDDLDDRIAHHAGELAQAADIQALHEGDALDYVVIYPSEDDGYRVEIYGKMAQEAELE